MPNLPSPFNNIKITQYLYRQIITVGGEVTWSTYSDKRIKDNVKNNVPGLSFIMKLKPVTYNLNIHLENKMMYGEKILNVSINTRFSAILHQNPCALNKLFYRKPYISNQGIDHIGPGN